MGRVRALGLALLVAGGCRGTIGEPPNEAEDHPAQNDPTKRAPNEPPPFAPHAAQMLRLTEAQYVNTVASVFGPQAVPSGDFPADRTDEPFASIGASDVATSARGVELYQALALEVGAAVLANKSAYPELADCGPSAADDPCIRDALSAFGRRLWRRSMTDAELDRYRAIVGAAGAEHLERGLSYAIAGLVHSPHFLYVPYSGETAPDGERRYTSVEMASRLAYFIWNSAPDDALIAAGESGALVETEALAAEVRRMLAEPRAEDLAGRFFAGNWNVGALADMDKDEMRFPEWTPSLRAAAREEFDRMLADATRPGADLFEIFTRDTTYANRELGAIYGVDVTGDELVPVTLPDKRAGLLTSVAVMAANAKPHRTSPTQRGVFLRAQVLCLPVPPPPADVEAELEEAEMMGGGEEEPMSIRDRLEQHRSDPVCAGCHALFDPMGMTLENFDAIGRYRTQDGGFDIDPSGGFEDVMLADAKALAAFLSEDPRAESCVVEQLYALAAGHYVTDGEEIVVRDLAEHFRAEGRAFDDLVVGIATSPGFRFMQEVAP